MITLSFRQNIFFQRTGGKGEMMASTNLQKAGSRAGAGSGGSPLAKVKKYGYVMLTSGPSNFNPGWMDCKITGLRDFGISFVFSFILW